MRASLTLSRLLGLVFVGMLATATLTYGAERAATVASKVKPASKAPKNLVVPDVRGKPYVFAEGMLEDEGFAWRVTGSVAGFAANTVVSQTPAPGTRVVDTGMPTIALELRTNGKYAQVGAPENAAPFAGTAIRLPAQLKRTPEAKVTAGKTSGSAATRPPAFLVAGAPPEPLSQPSLPAQARALNAWLTKHAKATAANRAHLSYENWLIVSGARNGWSRGAEALRILISVDKRAERLWRVGAKERLQVEKALLEVQARAR